MGVPDRAEILRIAADAQVDPRIVRQELEQPGTVRTHARERVQRALALRSLSSMVPESARAELRAELPALQEQERAILDQIAQVDPGALPKMPRVLPYDREQAERFRALYQRLLKNGPPSKEHVAAIPELQVLRDSYLEIKAFLERVLTRADRSEAREKRNKKRSKTQHP